MKAEERHELETNSLAKWLVQSGEKMGPYSAHLVYGALAIIAAIVIWQLSAWAIGAKDQDAWDAYAAATLARNANEEALDATATKYSGKPVGDMARLTWADAQVVTAGRTFFSAKDDAMEKLEAAEGAYQQLAKSAGDKSLRQHAKFGLARILEIRGEIDKAIEAYESVEGPFSAIATARVEQLKEYDAKDYAEWLTSARGGTQPPANNQGLGLSGPQFPSSMGTDPSPGKSAADELMDFNKMIASMNANLPEQPDQYEEKSNPLDIDLSLPAANTTEDSDAEANEE